MIARLTTPVIVLLLATPVMAQQPAQSSLSGKGTELFRGLLHYHGIKPITLEVLDDDARYSDTIVILFGVNDEVIVKEKAQWFNYKVSSVALRTLQNGGAVLIADDSEKNYSKYFQQDPTTSTLLATGKTVYHRTVSFKSGETINESCPYVVPLSPRIQIGQPTEWSLFTNLNKIATNKPGVLQQLQPSPFTRSLLAGYPLGSTDQGINGQTLTRNDLFAVGGSGTVKNPFRCLVVADQGVFANQMIAGVDTTLGQTDNLMFANRVVEWMKDAPGVNRSRCIFIDGSTVHEKFDDIQYEALAIPPVMVPPLPNPLDPKVQQAFTNSANEALARWQDRDGPNAALIRNPPDESRFNRVLRVLAVTAAIIIAVLLLRRLRRSGHTPDTPTIPTDTGRIAASGAPGSLARRKEEILQAGNYTDVVREYLQELFFAHGLPNPAPRRMPQVETSGRDRKTLLEDLDTLWDVAFGQDRMPILYSRWKELEPMIDAVRRAAENGRWRFTPGGNA